MLEEVKNRIASLGVPISSEEGSSDEAILTFIIERVTNFIKSKTNLNAMPAELKEVAIDKVTSEFLFTKKALGQLNIETLDFGLIAKTVQDGDTTTTFAVEGHQTPEAKFDLFLSYLQHNDMNYSNFRVLKW